VIQQSPGTAPSELVAAVAARFDDSAAEIEAHVLRFLAELRDEDLLVETDAAGQPPAANGRPPSEAFQPPVLEKYTDMQDLVVLDPVHEVDAVGWPQPKPDTSASGSAA
jgi:hypothetical protein